MLLATGEMVTGTSKGKLRAQNKRDRRRQLLQQAESSQWRTHMGQGEPWQTITGGEDHPGNKGMAPRGRARAHPAGNLLHEWEQYGCPTMTGKEWTRAEVEAAIERGPHASALTPEAIEHFRVEIVEKVAAGQAQVVAWDDIASSPPGQLKVSPVAAIPHKSKAY